VSIFRALRNWWWSQQRAIDLRVLWPLCCENASSPDHAKAAFATHAFNDPAWVQFYGHDGLVAYIDGLAPTSSQDQGEKK